MTSDEYREYLRTPHWAECKRNALEWACHRCQVCYSSQQLQVHHRTYERLWNELLSDLTVLCDPCHAKFHDKMSRRRRTQEKNAREHAEREARLDRIWGPIA